jgi:GGDEF domain-containing protein
MRLPNQEDDAPHEYNLDEVMAIANEGRRLVIFDRATGLYAYWYLQLRAAEEISRARRHTKGVHCISVWASTPDAIDAVRSRLKDSLRDHDLAAYLNNGHFVVLLTETDHEGSEIVRGRILHGLEPAVTAGIASFPGDCHTFDEMLERAKGRAGGGERTTDAA